MTVTRLSTSTPTYIGDGVSKEFPVDFQFFQKTDLRVFADGEELFLNAQYTVTGGEDKTGAVIFAVAPAHGVRINIIRDTALTQLAQFVEGDRFPVVSNEHGFDKLTLIAQELKNVDSKTITSPDPNDDREKLELPFADNRKDKLFGFGKYGEVEAVAVGDGLEKDGEKLSVIVDDTLKFEDKKVGVATDRITQIDKSTSDISTINDEIAAINQTIGNRASFGDGLDVNPTTLQVTVKPKSNSPVTVTADGVGVEIATTTEIQNGTAGKLVDAAGLIGTIATTTEIQNGTAGKLVDAAGLIGTIATTTEIQNGTAGKLVDAAGFIKYISDSCVKVYPNGGSEASPASIGINTRVVFDNPFPGKRVLCIPQIKHGNNWGNPGWGITTSGGISSSVGLSAEQLDPSGDIACQTGSTYVLSWSVGSGNPFGVQTNATTVPFRVIVIALN